MQPRRITLVADELLGYFRTGGLGTAMTFLAVALARLGHRTEVLYCGPLPTDELNNEWAQLYVEAGIGVRVLAHAGETVEPAFFTGMRDVELALRSDPPDVAIVQDFGAPAYTALRLRQLGLALQETLFVVRCSGTRQWVADASRKVRVLPGALGISILEQASLELADIVVSPSAYMIDWMREQGWKLPEKTIVIPSLTRSGATGEPPPESTGADSDRPVERVVFFGRLEERKGLRPFAAGLNALDPKLLEGMELEFLGKAATGWTPERVSALLSPTVRDTLRRVTFETDLDQHEVLALLSRPGTLAVIPSLEDNSPLTVYECLERGIPFMASSRGGTGELVAPEDRTRVLFEPTADGVEQALRRALTGGDALRPARAAFNATTSLTGWADVVAAPAGPRGNGQAKASVDVVVAHRGSSRTVSRCLAALAAQSYGATGVIVATAEEVPADELPGQPLLARSEGGSIEALRHAGLKAGSSPWVVFLDEKDVAKPELLETLVRAQAASGADVVSCGLQLHGEGADDAEHFFAGEPGALGLLTNGYGTVALIRRSLLGELVGSWPAVDPDWPLLARLSASGARIVSVPVTLVRRTAAPGTLERDPADALLVVEQLERGLPDHLRSLARLAAGLAADAQSRSATESSASRRAAQILRTEGLAGLGRAARRALRRHR